MDTYKSKTMLAVEAIREQILRGEVQPGERFDVRRVARELDMSITPIREALRILQADGLVAYDEHRSISAVQLRPEDAQELYLLRAQVESLTTRLAAERWQPADEQTILATHRTMVAAAGEEGVGQAAEANRAWHFAVYRAARTKFMEPTISRLWGQVSWSATWHVPGRLASSVAEHEAITEAILARKPALAERLMRKHIGGGQHAVLASRRKGDRPAAGTDHHGG